MKPRALLAVGALLGGAIAPYHHVAAQSPSRFRVTILPRPVGDSIHDTTRKARLHNFGIAAVAQLKQAQLKEAITNAEVALKTVLRPGIGFEARMQHCERPAFAYDPRMARITLCYDFGTWVRQIAERGAARDSSFGVRGATGSEVDQVVNEFLAFGVLHEVGHALIAQYKLPVLGGEEDAADGFAVYALARSDFHNSIAGAAQWFLWYNLDQMDGPQGFAPPTFEELKDPHPTSGRRFARVVCLAEGALRPAGAAPETVRCREDWDRLRSAWARLLTTIK